MDIDKLKTRWKKSSSPKLEDSSLDEATLKDIMGKRYNYLFLKILLPELMLAAVYLFLLVFLVVFFHFFSDVLASGVSRSRHWFTHRHSSTLSLTAFFQVLSFG
jgi:hypothetical protein